MVVKWPKKIWLYHTTTLIKTRKHYDSEKPEYHWDLEFSRCIGLCYKLTEISLI